MNIGEKIRTLQQFSPVLDQAHAKVDLLKRINTQLNAKLDIQAISALHETLLMAKNIKEFLLINVENDLTQFLMVLKSLLLFE